MATVGGSTTMKINGTSYSLRANPELQESGLVVTDKAIGTISSDGDIEEFMPGEATNVIITKQSDTDVATLRQLRDADILFELANGSKFNMSGAAVTGAIKHNTETGELTLESIKSDVAYYVD